jgi:hypothetical protein
VADASEVGRSGSDDAPEAGGDEASEDGDALSSPSRRRGRRGGRRRSRAKAQADAEVTD